MMQGARFLRQGTDSHRVRRNHERLSLGLLGAYGGQRASVGLTATHAVPWYDQRFLAARGASG